MKADWVGFITLGAIPEMRFVPAFVKILKHTFRRQIGLYY
jgi:hypothetical protein